jgi:hypothetical protein
MGQKQPQKPTTRSAARAGTGFETGARHQAHMEEDLGAVPGPRPPVGAEAIDSPYHSKPDAEESVPRRNPYVTFGVVGGLIAIIALAIAMLFSGPDYVETEGEPPETMQFEARR